MHGYRCDGKGHHLDFMCTLCESANQTTCNSTVQVTPNYLPKMFCGLLAVSRGLRGGVSVLEGRMQHALHLSSAAAASTVGADASSGTNAAPSRRQKKAAAATSVPKEPQNIHDAVTLVQQLSLARFDESIDIVINTGLDPRKPNQNVKGVAKLPHGQGKKVRVCVIAQGDDVAKAKQAGADVAGAEEIILLIQQGDVNFNTVIATPQMMAQVGKIGKVRCTLGHFLVSLHFLIVFFVDLGSSWINAQSQNGHRHQ